VNQLAASSLVAKIQAVWADRPWSQTKADQWADALEAIDERAGEATLRRLRISRDRCPTIAEFLTDARPATAPRDGHSLSCLCGGAGWMSVEQHDDHSTWEAFTRCPDGPPTLFIEPSAEFDPVASDAAHQTFQTLAATAESRRDLVEALHAAAAAYSNASRRTLL
jgi:hypothetical protein